MRRSGAALSVRATLITYLFWFVLAAVGGWVAWQWHATLIVLFSQWIESDLPRPIGWSAATLVGITRASLFINGSLWLMWMLYLESDLRHHAERKALIVRCLQILAVYAGIVVVCYAVILAIT
ncbi:MAG: hypothetical protein R2873_16095 [Caldilineaceae bacterium]|nr:hypothetical protein [Caldilineaceae bacterium]